MNTKLSIDYEMDDLLKLPGDELIPLQYNHMVDKIMCSQLCPCSESDQDLWEGYGDEFLRSYGRTTNLASLSDEESQDYVDNGENA